MAGQTSGRTTRTTGGRASGTPATADAPSTVGRTVDAPTTATPPTPVEPARTLPPPSPRTDVAVNLATTVTAFATGSGSQTVGYVQHVLRSRGFDPGSVNGVADHATRTALARFQESIGEAPTGLPTEHSLDYLGFDVIG